MWKANTLSIVVAVRLKGKLRAITVTSILINSNKHKSELPPKKVFFMLCYCHLINEAIHGGNLAAINRDYLCIG